MLKRGCSSPRERTTSLHAPSGILNTEDEHEAKALFRGFRGFQSGTTLVEVVREKKEAGCRPASEDRNIVKAAAGATGQN
jgi:hypothetical protein